MSNQPNQPACVSRNPTMQSRHVIKPLSLTPLLSCPRGQRRKEGSRGERKGGKRSLLHNFSCFSLVSFSAKRVFPVYACAVVHFFALTSSIAFPYLPFFSQSAKKPISLISLGAHFFSLVGRKRKRKAPPPPPLWPLRSLFFLSFLRCEEGNQYPPPPPSL